MENLIQGLMRDRHDWLAHLENELHIAAVRDGDLVSLKYNQIESPMHEPLVQQCRGMVVDAAQSRVLAWPYNKFWNHGEKLAAPIDWSTARVQEKLDGSLMILYYGGVERGWCVASSGHPTAGGSFGSDERTFREAFWSLVGVDGALWVRAADVRITYMFELCDSPNRVVVRHERPRLVLHGARWLESGSELTKAELAEQAAMLHCELVGEFPIGTVDGCLAAAEALDPLRQEGFVVVDASFNRVKIKSPRYVILHHLKGEATPRRAIELWQTGESEELLASFPEFRPVIEPVHAELDLIAEQAVKDFAENMPRASRKEFALAIKDRPWSSVLFRMLGEERRDIETAKAIMRRQSLASLERMLAGGEEPRP
ncbi:MAG TPA: RNA ligase [Microbacterium sp.]|nr:RNA ligase [Microbacterium sp.]